MNRLDEMFTSGPETLVAEARTIVAGRVTQFSKDVKEQSKGSTPIPVRWVISGRLDHPEALKGEAPKSPVSFRREEQSPFLPPRGSSPAWEQAYARWQDGDQAVVFFGRKPGEILRVLPSGSGDRDLIALIRFIVSVQAKSKDESGHAEAWRQELTGGSASMEARKVALRSLMKSTRDWTDVAETLRRVMAGPDRDLKTFAYGLVAYQIVHQKWTDLSEPSAFLCTYLSKTTDPELAEAYLQYVDLVLRFASDEEFREQRQPIRDQLRSCLKEQCLQAAAPIAAACKEVFARYPR